MVKTKIFYFRTLDSAKTLLVIAALVFTASAQTQNGLNCRFFTANFEFLGNAYSCDAQIIGNVASRIGFVSGVHETNRTNINVQRLNIENQRMIWLPYNIDQFFPSLTSLRVVNTGLFDIVPAELRPFTNLQVLDFSGNDLWYVDANLFERNLVLRSINFANNEVRQVERNAFSRQSQLQWLSFAGNYCSTRSANNRAAVLQMIPQLETECAGRRRSQMVEKRRTQRAV